jgi:hypothetical protein
MTVIKKFDCPSCSLPGEPSSAFDVCRACVLTGDPTALKGERLSTPPVESTDAAGASSGGPALQTGAPSDPDPVAPLAVDDCEERPWVTGQLVSHLIERVGDLEIQVEHFRDMLGEAGYLGRVDNNSNAALYLALSDAQHTQRARDVIAAQDHGFADEWDVALVLEQAIVVMDEHERVRDHLYAHEWFDDDRSLPEVVDDVLAFTVEAERAYGLLVDHDLLPPGEDLPGAVHALIAETVQVRAELGEAGYSCWAQPPAEVVRELIADAEQADALEQWSLREQRRSERMADVARRALTSAHAAAHDGAIGACPRCATDWAQLLEADKVAI